MVLLKKIGYTENQLSPGDFIKIHQSFLVNRSKIESVEGNDLILGTK